MRLPMWTPTRWCRLTRDLEGQGGAVRGYSRGVGLDSLSRLGRRDPVLGRFGSLVSRASLPSERAFGILIGDQAPSNSKEPIAMSSPTHCKRGHAFTPDNTRVRDRGRGKLERECIECSRARRREARKRACEVEGCKRQAYVARMCKAHYRFWKEHGVIGEPHRPDWFERFWSKVAVASSGCWEWTGNINRVTGYGTYATRQTSSGAVTEYTHRLAYMLTLGDIPKGHHVDHLCFNRACVNPGHLEAVTPAVNNQRMWNHKKKMEGMAS